MAKTDDPLTSVEDAVLLGVLEGLSRLKPSGWSAVRGDRQLVLRPSERTLGKFRITMSPSKPEPRFCVLFHSRSRSIWIACEYFPLTPASADGILAWARGCAEDEAKSRGPCADHGQPTSGDDEHRPPRATK